MKLCLLVLLPPSAEIEIPLVKPFETQTLPKVLNGSKLLLNAVDQSFGAPLENERTSRAAEREIGNEYSLIDGTHSKAPKDIIHGVRLKLNNYLLDLGITLVSISIIFHDRNGNPLLAADEEKSSTLGVVPSTFEPKDLVQIKADNRNKVVGFRVENGGEEIRILSDEFFARGFLPGEFQNGLEGRIQSIAPLFRKGPPILVPKNSVIAVAVPFAHTETLEEKHIPYGDLETRRDAINRVGGVYSCRYLTNKAVRRTLGLAPTGSRLLKKKVHDSRVISAPRRRSFSSSRSYPRSM